MLEAFCMGKLGIILLLGKHKDIKAETFCWPIWDTTDPISNGNEEPSAAETKDVSKKTRLSMPAHKPDTCQIQKSLLKILLRVNE